MPTLIQISNFLLTGVTDRFFGRWSRPGRDSSWRVRMDAFRTRPTRSAHTISAASSSAAIGESRSTYDGIMIAVAALALLQQVAFQGATSPPSGDTIRILAAAGGLYHRRHARRRRIRAAFARHAGVRQQLARHAARDVRPSVSECLSPGVQVERGRRARESRALSESA